EHRFVAAHLLDQLGLVAAQQALLVALEDSDLRVTTCAVITYQGTVDDQIKDLDLFERLERLIPRYPLQPTELKPIVWPWMKLTAGTVADVLPGNLGQRPPTRLIPHLSRMETNYRAHVVRLLAEQKVWDPATRDTLFALLSDASR